MSVRLRFVVLLLIGSSRTFFIGTTISMTSKQAAPSVVCASPKTQSLNIQQSLPMYYGCDGNDAIVDSINYAITISKPLPNIFIT